MRRYRNRPAGPRFAHDCDNCRFIGRKAQFDLYCCLWGVVGGVDCRSAVIARYGDHGPAYASSATAHLFSLASREMPPDQYPTYSVKDAEYWLHWYARQSMMASPAWQREPAERCRHALRYWNAVLRRRVLVSGSWGTTLVDWSTGVVIRAPDMDYEDIAWFDVDEYMTAYEGEVPTSVDICDIGYWDEELEYTPPEWDWRHHAWAEKESKFRTVRSTALEYGRRYWYGAGPETRIVYVTEHVLTDLTECYTLCDADTAEVFTVSVLQDRKPDNWCLIPLA